MTATVEALLHEIVQIISDTAGIAEEEITPGKSLAEDLDIESLPLAELTIRLEAEYKIDISDEEIVEARTVQDVIDLVQEKVAQGGEGR